MPADTIHGRHPDTIPGGFVGDRSQSQLWGELCEAKREIIRLAQLLTRAREALAVLSKPDWSGPYTMLNNIRDYAAAELAATDPKREGS